MVESQTDTLKYLDDINTHAPIGCPPNDAVQKEVECFRYVMNPIIDSDFYSYVKLGNLPRQTDKVHAKCKYCGLSIFESQQAALDKYNSLPNKSRLPYTHVAKGKILKEYGICTPAIKGHFTLFEYAGVNLTTKFTIVCPIPK